MRPEHIAETRDWLHLAETDLRAAERLLSGASLVEPTLFHCQQAAEKALKAYLVWNDQPFRRTHDLVEVLDLCAAVDPEFMQLDAETHALTPYAVDIRYRRRVPPPSLDDARRALDEARRVVSFVIARLPREVTIE